MNLPTVKLNSDYVESWDHMFDVGKTDFVWNRFSVNLSRKAALEEMRRLGARVPYYDTVSHMCALLEDYKPAPTVVVYTEPLAHRGEGKELTHLTLNTLLDHGERLAMLYVPQVDGRKISWRYLRMGQKIMWLRYESDDDWRSNCGSEIKITECSRPSAMHIGGGPPDVYRHPAIAIDYVSSIGGMWFAIDLNTSPGIDHTPFTEKYSVTEIVDSVKEWFSTNAPRIERVAGCPTA